MNLPMKKLLLCLFIQFLSTLSTVKAAEGSLYDMIDKANKLPNESAIKALEEILNKEPSFSPASYNLGCLLLSEKPSDAIKYFEQATKSVIPELSFRAFHNLAIVLHKAGKLEKALIASKKAHDGENKKNKDYENTFKEIRKQLIALADEARRKAEEEAKRLKLLTTTLTDAYATKPYKFILQASGGSGKPYAFTTDPAKPLPKGLELKGNEILGIPDEKEHGNKEFIIIVKDKANETIRASVKLKIWETPKINPDAMPEGIIEQYYNAYFESKGIPNPIWEVLGLPKNLSFENKNKNIEIIGVPEKIGEHELTIKVTDENRKDLSISKKVKLKITNLFTIETKDLPPATAWAVYKHTLKIKGPIAEYKFKGENEDLSCSETGTITGTPNKAGTSNIDITIESSNGTARVFKIPLPVNPPPVITEDKPISLTQGRPANHQIKSEGGTRPFTWRITEGVLPDGLRLDPDGVIRGATLEQTETEIEVSLIDKWKAETKSKVKINIKEADKQDKPPKKDKKDKENKEKDKKDKKDKKDENKKNDKKNDKNKKSDENKSEKEKQDEQNKADEKKINKAALEKWLNSLPEEEKDALMKQLILKRGSVKGDPW